MPSSRTVSEAFCQMVHGNQRPSSGVLLSRYQRNPAAAAGSPMSMSKALTSSLIRFRLADALSVASYLCTCWSLSFNAPPSPSGSVPRNTCLDQGPLATQ